MSEKKLIGKKVDYLDKGYVKLIDYMGDDALIAKGARTSFDEDAYEDPARNQGLINYLVEHRHTSPLELPCLVFEIKMPIFVMRQHVRHRTACLTGDTLITFVDKKGSSSPRLQKTIGELYDQWVNGQIDGNPNSKTGRRCMKKRIRKRRLRILNEDTGEFQNGHIKNVYFNGVEPVYLVKTSNCKQIKMTLNHQIYTNKGWCTLRDAVGWDDEKGMTKESYIACNGVPAYQDYSWLKKKKEDGYGVQDMADEAGCSYHTIRKWLKIHNLSFTRKEIANLFTPWNKGKSGYKVDRVFTDEELKNLRRHRSGQNSNLWKGGVSSEREKIEAWTSRQVVHLKKRGAVGCTKCGSKEDLQCHHVVPVSVDKTLAYDLDNLRLVCEQCHKEIHSSPRGEWEFAISVNPDLKNSYKRSEFRTNHAGYKLLADFQKIVSVEYVGCEKVYDLEVEGPYHNFVANGMVVHNSLNETSLRYSEQCGDYYLPDLERFCTQDKWNKQGSGEPLPEGVAMACQEMMKDICDREWDTYQKLLKAGVSKETARGVLNVNYYTKCVWKMDLHNLLHYLKLRNSGHAQWEIAELAKIVEEFVEELYPQTYSAFCEFSKGSTTFSNEEIAILQDYVFEGDMPKFEKIGGSKRRARDFYNKLGLDYDQMMKGE